MLHGGFMPSRGADGNLWPEGTWRAQKAGQPVAASATAGSLRFLHVPAQLSLQRLCGAAACSRHLGRQRVGFRLPF